MVMHESACVRVGMRVSAGDETATTESSMCFSVHGMTSGMQHEEPPIELPSAPHSPPFLHTSMLLLTCKRCGTQHKLPLLASVHCVLCGCEISDDRGVPTTSSGRMTSSGGSIPPISTFSLHCTCTDVMLDCTFAGFQALGRCGTRHHPKSTTGQHEESGDAVRFHSAKEYARPVFLQHERRVPDCVCM